MPRIKFQGPRSIDSREEEKIFEGFRPRLGLPSQRAMLSYQKIKIFTGKKQVSVRSTACHHATKRYVKITMYLGLDIIIKLKFTTNFDRCMILNVLNL